MFGEYFQSIHAHISNFGQNKLLFNKPEVFSSDILTVLSFVFDSKFTILLPQLQACWNLRLGSTTSICIDFRSIDITQILNI